MNNIRWKQLGGQTGIALAVVGFLLLFLGWNGAASYDRVAAQFPYLISGGLAGLSVVVLGAALLVVNAQRQDRAAMLDSLAELREAVERISMGGAPAGVDTARLMAEAEESGLVVAGPTSYHRPSCRLLDGRGALPTITVATAEERELTACRACDAADLALPVAERATPRRRRSKAASS